MTGKRVAALIAVAAVLWAGCGPAPGAAQLVVGATTHAQSTVLAELYAGALRYYGAPAMVRHVADPLTALEDAEVDVAVGFTGRVLQRFVPGAGAIQQELVYRAMVAALPAGLRAGDYAMAADDKPTAVVTEATAARWDGRELTALVRHCGELRPGAADAVVPPADLGGCDLAVARRFGGEPALFDALGDRAINVAWTTAADPGVPSDLVVLADRRPPLVQAQNVVPLYRRNELTEREVRALNEVAGEFTTTALAGMVRAVADGAQPHQAAEDWLAAHPLGRS